MMQKVRAGAAVSAACHILACLLILSRTDYLRTFPFSFPLLPHPPLTALLPVSLNQGVSSCLTHLRSIAGCEATSHETSRLPARCHASCSRHAPCASSSTKAAAHTGPGARGATVGSAQVSAFAICRLQCLLHRSILIQPLRWSKSHVQNKQARSPGWTVRAQTSCERQNETLVTEQCIFVLHVPMNHGAPPSPKLPHLKVQCILVVIVAPESGCANTECSCQSQRSRVMRQDVHAWNRKAVSTTSLKHMEHVYMWYMVVKEHTYTRTATHTYRHSHTRSHTRTATHAQPRTLSLTLSLTHSHTPSFSATACLIDLTSRCCRPRSRSWSGG